ncbi:MAG: intercellular trafficking and secretion [Paramarteilia canceri]
MEVVHLDEAELSKITEEATPVSPTQFDQNSEGNLHSGTEHPKYGNCKDHIVERRFTQFFDLYTRLSQQYPDCVIAHPPEKTYFNTNENMKIEECRKLWLLHFLRLLLINPRLRNSYIMVGFLTDKNGPELLTKKTSEVIKSQFNKLTDKIVSLKYADADSDEVYLLIKDGVDKIEIKTKRLDPSLKNFVLKNKIKEISDSYASIEHLMVELSKNSLFFDLNFNSSLNAISKLFGAQADCMASVKRSEDVHTNLKSFPHSYDELIKQLSMSIGVVQMILITIKRAFEVRDRKFRPVYDYDSKLRSKRIEYSFHEDNDQSIDHQRSDELKKEISELKGAMQKKKDEFDEFSTEQKVILNQMKKYLDSYLKHNQKQILTKLLDIEKIKLECLEMIQKELE